MSMLRPVELVNFFISSRMDEPERIFPSPIRLLISLAKLTGNEQKAVKVINHLGDEVMKVFRV